MSNLKVTKGSTSLGVYHSLRDSFPVKVAHLIQKLDILKQDRSSRSHCHGGCLGINGNSISSCEDIRCLKTVETFNAVKIVWFVVRHGNKILKRLKVDSAWL